MKKKLKCLCSVVWRGLFVLLLFHGTRGFGYDSFYHIVNAPQFQSKILGLHLPLADEFKNGHGMKDVSIEWGQFRLLAGSETVLSLLPDHLPVHESNIHGELPASGSLSVNIANPEGSQRHQSGKKSPEKCEYCGSVSYEKVEKFFHDLFKAGVVITLCNGLVVIPLWWWSVRRRPFLDVDSWTNVKVHTPLPASASVEAEVKP
jgi:hypothetical protein